MEEKEKLVPKQVIDAINEYFDEPIVTTDVGQNQMWTTQFLQLYGRRQMLTSGGLGTMGYGLPAAIGAAIGNPGREVVCVSGDGGFQMNSQEIATAVIQELPITICILNNGYLGMVRQWQDLFYDKAYAGTCLRRRKSCTSRQKILIRRRLEEFWFWQTVPMDLEPKKRERRVAGGQTLLRFLFMR